MPSPNGRGKRAALYRRVSTDEQAKSGYSLPDQLRQLRQYAETHGYTIVDEAACDDGYSGATTDRPGLRHVMELAEAGAIDVVLATRRNRFFRNRLYRLEMDRDMKAYGVRLVATNDTGNRFADGFQDDFAEYEHEEFSRRSRQGKLEKARQGKVIAGSVVNYGFRYTEDRDYLEVDEDAMPVVRRIFGMVSEGVPMHAVKRRLEAEGEMPPGYRLAVERGRVPSTSWSRTFIRKIILDDLYKPHTRRSGGVGR
jgi:site-specific DNA recombinase